MKVKIKKQKIKQGKKKHFREMGTPQRLSTLRLAVQAQSVVCILSGSFVPWKSMVGGQLEVIWKKLSGDEFRQNGMSLETPVKELGVILEAGQTWARQSCPTVFCDIGSTFIYSRADRDASHAPVLTKAGHVLETCDTVKPVTENCSELGKQAVATSPCGLLLHQSTGQLCLCLLLV